MKTCLLLSEEQKINAADQSSWFLLSEEFPCSHSQIHQLHDKAVTSKTPVCTHGHVCVFVFADYNNCTKILIRLAK